MGHSLQSHKLLWRNKKFIKSLVVGLIFLIIGISATFFAIIYATESSSSSVTDIILSNIRTFDIDAIFIYGPVLFWVLIIVYIALFELEKIPFTLKSVALFLIIRSSFISMTHIGPFPSQIHIGSSGIFSVFTTGNDLFFSSHTGMPFLIALIFWDNKPMRLFSIFASIFFGIIVLMGHLHYSIDVFAAFFITYTIFHIAKKIFKKDWVLFF